MAVCVCVCVCVLDALSMMFLSPFIKSFHKQQCHHKLNSTASCSSQPAVDAFLKADRWWLGSCLLPSRWICDKQLCILLRSIGTIPAEFMPDRSMWDAHPDSMDTCSACPWQNLCIVDYSMVLSPNGFVASPCEGSKKEMNKNCAQSEFSIRSLWRPMIAGKH